MNKKHTALVLASLLLVSSLASCSGGTDSADTTPTTDAKTQTEAVTEPEQLLYSAALTPVDYKGAEFRVQTSNNVNGMDYNILHNYADAETGEVINDALFRRDQFMEETFNITMKYTCDDTSSAPQMATQLTKNVMAGDDSYHLIIQDHATVTKALAQQGAIYPLNYIDTIK